MEFPEKYITKLFAAAEIAKYSREEREIYENSLKYYRDIKNVVDTAYEDGKVEVAKNLKRMGFSTDQIIEATGLNKEDIEKL